MLKSPAALPELFVSMQDAGCRMDDAAMHECKHAGYREGRGLARWQLAHGITYIDSPRAHGRTRTCHVGGQRA
jgi:hypothetical protein